LTTLMFYHVIRRPAKKNRVFCKSDSQKLRFPHTGWCFAFIFFVFSIYFVSLFRSSILHKLLEILYNTEKKCI
jgi:hypothetical protein